MAASHVIQSAIAALEATAGLADAIAPAADCMSGRPGKIVVTGMGKAGLIGAKIAATLRSTGQPAAFLDPAQALHGDMGMLGRWDGLLAISNSGETAEVLAVAHYCTERQIPVIVITAGETSALARMADVGLLYPRMPEGCPIGRAPMASAVQMLCIGDMLAAELMTRRGFTEEDFLALHHGGYLGQSIAADLVTGG